jgi:hypothetical protein
MNLFQVVVTAVLTTLAVLALGVAAAWSLWPTSVAASATIGAHAGTWDPQSHCSAFESDHLAIGEAALDAALGLNEAQQQALVPVVTAIDTWRGELHQTCTSADLSSLDASLASIQTVLDQSASAFEELRPALSSFHASLSAEQQQTLHSYLQSHRTQRAHRGLFGHGH